MIDSWPILCPAKGDAILYICKFNCTDFYSDLVGRKHYHRGRLKKKNVKGNFLNEFEIEAKTEWKLRCTESREKNLDCKNFEVLEKHWRVVKLATDFKYRAFVNGAEVYYPSS